MLISVLKSKINSACVTEAELYYEGSITVDESILKAADIAPGEKVQVLNINNGSRIETYTIAGKPGSGIVCLNGPAARKGVVGDKVIIVSYGLVEKGKESQSNPRIVYLDDQNKIKN
ncbi:MAG: aspartate 1-decarboxylase [Candidatus Aceula meridiana]|nr:aspartate 1-decarboxylase [Candidatus Aceula meridiana]